MAEWLWMNLMLSSSDLLGFHLVLCIDQSPDIFRKSRFSIALFFTFWESLSAGPTPAQRNKQQKYIFSQHEQFFCATINNLTIRWIDECDETGKSGNFLPFVHFSYVHCTYMKCFLIAWCVKPRKENRQTERKKKTMKSNRTHRDSAKGNPRNAYIHAKWSKITAASRKTTIFFL